GRAAAGRLLVGDLRALRDVGLDIVGRDNARAGNDLTLLISLQGRDLQVQEAGRSGVEDRVSELTGRATSDGGGRQVDAERIGEEAGRVVLRLTALHAQTVRVAAGHELDVAVSVTVCRAGCRNAQAGADVLVEAVGRLDDARLDLHLPHRHVDLLHQCP